jgi:hypothetical protein
VTINVQHSHAAGPLQLTVAGDRTTMTTAGAVQEGCITLINLKMQIRPEKSAADDHSKASSAGRRCSRTHIAPRPAPRRSRVRVYRLASSLATRLASPAIAS